METGSETERGVSMTMGMLMFTGGIAGSVVCLLLGVMILATSGTKRRRMIDEIQKGL